MPSIKTSYTAPLSLKFMRKVTLKMNTLLLHRTKFLNVLFIFLFSFTNETYAQDGSLDQTFGNNGKTITDFNGFNDYGISMSLQPDGKVVVAGYPMNHQFDNVGFELARYLTNGTLDSLFGVNGKIITSFGGVSEFATAVALTIDDKIIVSGSSSFKTAIVRYSKNGNLDSSFGDNGKVNSDVGIYNPRCMSVQIDDKIIIGGFSNIDTSSFFVLARFLPNGSIDSSFGMNGRTVLNFGTRVVGLFALTIQSDGKIVLAGHVSSDGMSDFDFALGRINSNGSPDLSFGVNGKVVTEFKDFNSVVHSIHVLPEGNILAIGAAFNNSSTRGLAMAKYTFQGKLDSTLNNIGLLTNTEIPLDIHSGILQPDGKIIVIGNYYDALYNSAFGIARYAATGEIDITFGEQGKTINFFSPTYSSPSTVALTGEGKIVVCGSISINNNSDFIVARYNNNSTLPISLVSFTGMKKSKSILLNWNTNLERNNNYFIIQRSSDGRHFQDIHKVKSTGNSTQVRQYNYEDFFPINGINYYRLKQVDFDGHFTSSRIILVNFNLLPSIVLYPNPVKNILIIRGLISLTLTEVRIIDFSGKTLQKLYTNNNNFEIDVKSLLGGTYYLQIEQNNITTILKFIK